MQNIVIDKPYRFVQPHHGRFWPNVFRFMIRRHLDRSYGIADSEIRGLEHLRRSLAAGHGILLAPNHCRPGDPMVLGLLVRALHQPIFVMASWHLFMQSRFQTWLIRRMGAFSIYREGMDREALKTAIDILAEARRPLVVFPEGVISRTNDRLGSLLEGTAFMARSAAKQRARAKPPGQVVVHPIALKYLFLGNLEAAVEPVLEQIESRFSWRSQRELPLLERIYKVGLALLALKEIEYFGAPQSGEVHERLAGLIDHLLVPLENEWLAGRRDEHVVARVKRLRAAILPDLVTGEITEEERARRWRQLADLYLAQQINFYPHDYIASRPTAERLLETVERFEEDLTDKARVHRPLRVVIQIGEPLQVSPARDRSSDEDPLIEQLEVRLQQMLDALACESPVLPLSREPPRDASPSPGHRQTA